MDGLEAEDVMAKECHVAANVLMEQESLSFPIGIAFSQCIC